MPLVLHSASARQPLATEVSLSGEVVTLKRINNGCTPDFSPLTLVAFRDQDTPNLSMMLPILLLCSLALAAARPDVSHVINGPSFDYGVPLVGAPNNINEITSSPRLFTSATQNLLARLSKEDHTGYDYPKPTVPFDLPAPSSVSIVQSSLNENRQYLPPVAENRVSTTIVAPSTTARYLPPRVAAASTNRPLVASRDYLPPLRPAASAVSPRVVNRDYLPPVTTERRVATSTYVPPVTSETRVSSTAYLPPSTAETRISTTTFRAPTPPAVIYNRGSTPAAASPVPVTVAAEDTTGYDYPRPTVNFDLPSPSPSPSNDVPIVIPTTSREYLPPVSQPIPLPSPSAPPLILIPSSTTQQTVISSTQPDLPPAPEVILPSHTLDEDGYKYRVPSKPFTF